MKCGGKAEKSIKSYVGCSLKDIYYLWKAALKLRIRRNTHRMEEKKNSQKLDPTEWRKPFKVCACVYVVGVNTIKVDLMWKAINSIALVTLLWCWCNLLIRIDRFNCCKCDIIHFSFYSISQHIKSVTTADTGDKWRRRWQRLQKA